MGLTKSGTDGTGTQTLSGTISYTGATTVNNGTLVVSGQSYFNTGRTTTVASGAVFELNNSNNIFNSLMPTSTVTGAGTFRLSGNSTINQSENGVNGTRLTFAMDSGGLIDLQGTSRLTNGGWGVMNWTNNKADMNIASGATLDVWDGQDVIIDALTGSGTVDKVHGGNSPRLLKIGVDNGSGTFSGTIKNSGGDLAITKDGSGTQTLSGTNTYTGATTVSKGTLNLTGSLTSNITVASAAILSGSGTSTGTISLSSGSTIVGNVAGNSVKGSTVTATTSVNIAGSDGSGTIGSHTMGVVRYNTGTGPDTASFSKAGYRSGATLANVGADGGETRLTYTSAALTWNAETGTWATDTVAWQGGDTKFFQGDAVTFDDSGTGGGAARAVTLNTLVTPGSVSFNNSTSTPYTISGTGAIGGATSLTKSGTGVVTLSNSNSYTGATTVSEGTLKVTGSIGSSAVTVNGTGTVLASGTSGTIGKSVTIQNGAILAAGGQNTVGSATVGSDGLSFASGSIFEWDINQSSTSSGFDTLSVAGNLAADTTGAIFKVVFGGSALTDIQNTGNAFWNTASGTQTWDMTDIFGKNFTTNAFTIVDTSTTVSTYGSFTISGSSLTWTAVPEPTSALAGLLITAGLLRRRRAVG